MKTYKEQFDKLTEAYIKGEVNPFRSHACFVGNLLDGYPTWYLVADRYSEPAQALGEMGICRVSDGTYTGAEILLLERNFMTIVRGVALCRLTWVHCPTERMEETLFRAFESTLEMLKQIHISKGEVIDEVPVFTKRTKEVVC